MYTRRRLGVNTRSFPACHTKHTTTTPRTTHTHTVAILAQDVTGVPGWRSWVLVICRDSRGTLVSVFCSCDPSMPSLMRSLNSSHVVGAVSDVHGVCGLLPSAGLVSSILLSSLFWSSASCAMFGRSKGPNPLRCVDTALVGMKTALARLLVLMESACWIRRGRR